MSNEHSSLVNKTDKQNDDILLDENKVLKNITGIQFTDLGNDHDKATLWAVVMIMGIAVFVVSGLMVSLFWKRRKVAIITDNASEKPDTLNMTPTRRFLEKTELDNVRRDKYRSSSLGNIYSSSPRTRADELLLDTRASHRHSII